MISHGINRLVSVTFPLGKMTTVISLAVIKVCKMCIVKVAYLKVVLNIILQYTTFFVHQIRVSVFLYLSTLELEWTTKLNTQNMPNLNCVIYCTIHEIKKKLFPRKGTEISATCMRTDGFGLNECRYVQTLIQRHRFSPQFVAFCEWGW
jgi:hypothetical protein